jgi:hypothetical protein
MHQLRHLGDIEMHGVAQSHEVALTVHPGEDVPLWWREAEQRELLRPDVYEGRDDPRVGDPRLDTQPHLGAHRRIHEQRLDRETNR